MPSPSSNNTFFKTLTLPRRNLKGLQPRKIEIHIVGDKRGQPDSTTRGGPPRADRHPGLIDERDGLGELAVEDAQAELEADGDVGVGGRGYVALGLEHGGELGDEAGRMGLRGGGEIDGGGDGRPVQRGAREEGARCRDGQGSPRREAEARAQGDEAGDGKGAEGHVGEGDLGSGGFENPRGGETEFQGAVQVAGEPDVPNAEAVEDGECEGAFDGEVAGYAAADAVGGQEGVVVNAVSAAPGALSIGREPRNVERGGISFSISLSARCGRVVVIAPKHHMHQIIPTDRIRNTQMLDLRHNSISRPIGGDNMRHQQEIPRVVGDAVAAGGVIADDDETACLAPVGEGGAEGEGVAEGDGGLGGGAGEAGDVLGVFELHDWVGEFGDGYCGDCGGVGGGG